MAPLNTPTESLRKKCLHWLRKQYYNVILEDVCNYHIMAWKGRVSSGVCMLPDRESVEAFKARRWYPDMPGQYRVCFTFPGIILNSEVPHGWGIIECYNGEFLEKKTSAPESQFDEMAELEILGHLLSVTDTNAPQEDISAIVGVFRECFEASGLNDNRKDLVDLVSTGQFQYLFRGKEIG